MKLMVSVLVVAFLGVGLQSQAKDSYSEGTENGRPIWADYPSAWSETAIGDKKLENRIHWSCPNPPTIESKKCFRSGADRLQRVGCTMSTSATPRDCRVVDSGGESTWLCVVQTLDCKFSKTAVQSGCKKLDIFTAADKAFFKTPYSDSKSFHGICVEEIASGSKAQPGSNGIRGDMAR
jgi:hypothetical protein